VPSAFCYEKYPFRADTKSIETSIDTNRRGFADTESIEPDIDTKSAVGVLLRKVSVRGWYKSIETSVDTNRRKCADTESIEPDIDTKSRRGEIDTKRIASANRNTMAQPAKSHAPRIWIRQIKAARALLYWSQEDLACVGEVSLVTIKRLEAKDGLLRGRDATKTKLRQTFEDAGIEFIPANDRGGPGVRLRIQDIKKAGLI
jgi:hypothetical protein